MNSDILILGGGASGMAAALGAKKRNPRADVTIAEALPRVGKKLLATGNGRCNIMNLGAESNSYEGDSRFISPALDAYRRQYKEFWDEIGVPLVIEDAGRMYPRVNQAAAVLDALRLAIKECGIIERTGFRASKIEPVKDGFKVTSDEREAISCKRLILACGGMAGKGLGESDSFARLLKPLGHRLKPVYPALTCLKTRKGLLNGLKGVRLKGKIDLLLNGEIMAREKGEVLFQDDGLSGIAAMQLSLTASPLLSKQKGLSAALYPLKGLSDEDIDVEKVVRGRIECFPNRAAQELFLGELNKMIALNALKRAGIKPDQSAVSFSESQIKALISALEKWEIPLIAVGGFSEAQVMLGGADTKDFEAETLMSKLVYGLYAAGEMLDVTGPCGGYNLEWAWASGLLAGKSAAESFTL